MPKDPSNADPNEIDRPVEDDIIGAGEDDDDFDDDDLEDEDEEDEDEA